MGESLPDSTALNNYAVEWENMATDLYNLASGVKSAAETPAWSGKAHRYFVESGHLVYQQVFDTAAQTWRVAQMIREYAKEIDKIKKQQLKEAIIFIVGMALGVAAFFPGLSTLINMIGKLVSALLNALGKILPDIAKAVMPFVSTITTGAIVGAGFAVIPEGIATAITGVPFKVDPLTWGLSIGLGAGGALLLGGKNPFGKIDSHRPNITTDEGAGTGTGSGSGTRPPAPNKPTGNGPTGDPKATPNGQPLPAGPTRVPKGLRTITNELKQEWQHTKDAFGFGPRTPTGHGPTTNQGGSRSDPNGQGAPPPGRTSGSNANPRGNEALGPTGLRLPPGEGRTNGPSERPPAANLDGPNPGAGRPQGDGRSPAPHDPTEMGKGSAETLRQPDPEPKLPAENRNGRGLTEPPPQKNPPAASAGGGKSGPGEGPRATGGGESANGHVNGNPSPRQAIPREVGEQNGQLHGDPHGNPPPRPAQGGGAPRTAPEADLGAGPRTAPNHQADGSRPFERPAAAKHADATGNGHGTPPRSQSPGPEQHGNVGSQRAGEGGAPQPPRSQSPGPEQHGNPGSQRPADQHGGAAPPKSAVNSQGKAGPEQSRTPGGPEHPGAEHPRGSVRPSLKVETDVNGYRPVDNGPRDADVSPISPGPRDPKAHAGRTESPVSPISPKAGSVHEPPPANSPPPRPDSPEGSAAPSPTRVGSDSPRPSAGSESHVTLPAGPHDGPPSPTRAGADTGAPHPAAESAPKAAKDPVHTQPGGGDPVKADQFHKRVELARTDLRAQAKAEAKMAARNADAERTFAKRYEQWSDSGKRSLPADRKDWLEKEFVRHVEQMRQRKLDAEMNAKLPSGRTPKVKDLGRDQSYDVWQSGRWLKDAFDYHAKLDGAITRAGRDFDRAYQSYQKNHPDSALNDGHAAQMKDQLISEIKNGYNTTFRDGVGTRSTSRFNKWYDDLKSGLDNRFTVENELDKFMKKDFSDAMRQWKSDQKLDTGAPRSWEKRVAEDLRNQLRADLTQRRPADEFEPGRPGNGKADTAGRLKQQFDQHEQLARERAAEGPEMNHFGWREDGSGFDRTFTELAKKFPDTVGRLRPELVERQRLDFLSDSRQVYLDARRGGAGHDDAMRAWADGHTALEGKAGDKLVVAAKLDEMMTRGLDGPAGRPPTDEGLSWVRQAQARDLELAYHEVFDGHPGQLAQGKSGFRVDAELQAQWEARWQDWEARLDTAAGTLNTRLAYEQELRRVIEAAGRDFNDIMGPAGSPKHAMSDRVRDVLATRFRDNVATAHHEIYGHPGDDIAGRLAMEKGGAAAFGSVPGGSTRPGDDPGAGGGARPAAEGDGGRPATGKPAAERGPADGPPSASLDSNPAPGRAAPPEKTGGGNSGKGGIRLGERPAAEGDASRPGSSKPLTQAELNQKVADAAVKRQAQDATERENARAARRELTLKALENRAQQAKAEEGSAAPTRTDAEASAPARTEPAHKAAEAARKRLERANDGQPAVPQTEPATPARSEEPPKLSDAARAKQLRAEAEQRRATNPEPVSPRTEPARSATGVAGDQRPPAGTGKQPKLALIKEGGSLGRRLGSAGDPPAAPAVKPAALNGPGSIKDAAPGVQSGKAGSPAAEKPVKVQSDRSKMFDEMYSKRPDPAAHQPAPPRPGGTDAPRPKTEKVELEPRTPRLSRPVEGRQLLRIDEMGNVDLVRVTAEPRMKGEGHRVGGPDRGAEFPVEAASAQGRDSFQYHHLRADGTKVRTELRPGETPMHVEPASGTTRVGGGYRYGERAGGELRERHVKFDAEAKQWKVQEIGRDTPAPPKTTEPEPQRYQVLRRNPDGTIDLLTFRKRPADPGASSTTDGTRYHELNPKTPRGWHDLAIGTGQKPVVERLSRPETPGRLPDGTEVPWLREPSSLLVRHQETGLWSPLGKPTEGSWSVKGDPAGGKSAPGLRPNKPPSGRTTSGDAIYKWDPRTRDIEPVRIKPNELDIAEIGVHSGDVRYHKYTAAGDAGGAKPNLKVQPDGSLAATNAKKLGAHDLTYDPETGQISHNGAKPKPDVAGAVTKFKPTGTGGTQQKTGGRSSTTTTTGAVTFSRNPGPGEQHGGAPEGRAPQPDGTPARDPRDRGTGGGSNGDGAFRDPHGGGSTMTDDGVVPSAPRPGRDSEPVTPPGSGRGGDPATAPRPGASHAPPTATPGAQATINDLRQLADDLRRYQETGYLGPPSSAGPSSARPERQAPAVPNPSPGERQVLRGGGDGAAMNAEARARYVRMRRAQQSRIQDELALLRDLPFPVDAPEAPASAARIAELERWQGMLDQFRRTGVFGEPPRSAPGGTSTPERSEPVVPEVRDPSPGERQVLNGGGDGVTMGPEARARYVEMRRAQEVRIQGELSRGPSAERRAELERWQGMLGQFRRTGVFGEPPKPVSPEAVPEGSEPAVAEVRDPSKGEQLVLKGGGDGVTMGPEARARYVEMRRAQEVRIQGELSRGPSAERRAELERWQGMLGQFRRTGVFGEPPKQVSSEAASAKQVSSEAASAKPASSEAAPERPARTDRERRRNRLDQAHRTEVLREPPKRAGDTGSRPERVKRRIPEVPNPTPGEKKVLSGGAEGVRIPDPAARAQFVLDRRAWQNRVTERLAAAEAALVRRRETAQEIGNAAGAGFHAIPAAHGYVLYRGEAPTAPMAQFDRVRDSAGRVSLIADPSVDLFGADLDAVAAAAGALRTRTGAIADIRPPWSRVTLTLAAVERAATRLLQHAGPNARLSMNAEPVHGTPAPGGRTVPVDAASRPTLPMLVRALHVYASPRPAAPTPYGLRADGGRMRVPATGRRWFVEQWNTGDRRILWWHEEGQTAPVLPPGGEGDLFLVGHPGSAVPDEVRAHVEQVHGGLPGHDRPKVAWHGPETADARTGHVLGGNASGSALPSTRRPGPNQQSDLSWAANQAMSKRLGLDPGVRDDRTSGSAKPAAAPPSSSPRPAPRRTGTAVPRHLEPRTPRPTRPAEGRQLLRTDGQGTWELVRVSAESAMKGAGRRVGGSGTDPRPPEESAPDTSREPDSFRYVELGDDGSRTATRLRPGEVVLRGEPAAGSTKAGDRFLAYDRGAKTWAVRVIPRAEARSTADREPEQQHQLLRRNPDGTVDLLTFRERPAVGRPQPSPDGTAYHDLSPRGRPEWYYQEIGGPAPDVVRVATPQSPGRRLDGAEVRWDREPTALLVRHQQSGRWSYLDKTDGAWSVKGDGSAGQNPPGLTLTRPAARGEALYRLDPKSKSFTPAPTRPNDIDIAEIGVESRTVRFDKYVADAGPGGAKPNLKVQPDGSLAADNGKKLGAHDLKYDPETGEIFFPGGGARPKPDEPGGPSDGKGKPAPGTGSTAFRGGGRGSATQEDGTVRFAKQTSEAEPRDTPPGEQNTPPAGRDEERSGDETPDTAAEPSVAPGGEGAFRDPHGGSSTTTDEGMLPLMPASDQEAGANPRADGATTAQAIADAAGGDFHAMPAGDGFVLYRGAAPRASTSQFERVAVRSGRVSLFLDPSIGDPFGNDRAAVAAAAAALRLESQATGRSVVVVRPPRPSTPMTFTEVENAAAEILRDAGPGARITLPDAFVTGSPGNQTLSLDAASRLTVPMLARTHLVFASPPPVNRTPYGLASEGGRLDVPSTGEPWLVEPVTYRGRRILWWHREGQTEPRLPLGTPNGTGDLILVGEPGDPVPDEVRTRVEEVYRGLPEQSRPDIAWHGPDSLPRTPVPVPDQENVHVMYGWSDPGSMEMAHYVARTVRRPGMTTVVIAAPVDAEAGTVLTAAGPIQVAEIDEAVAALDGAASIVFLDQRAAHPNVTTTLAEGHAAEVIVPGAAVQFDGTTFAPAGDATWHQHSIAMGSRPLGRRLDQPPPAAPTLTAAQFSALRQRGQAVLSVPVDGDGLARSIQIVAPDQVARKLREAGYDQVNSQTVRQFIARWFAADLERRPDHYRAFGIGPGRRDHIVRDLAERGNTDGVAGQILFQQAAMAFELNLRMMNADGRVAEHGDPSHPSATLVLAGSAAGPTYLPMLPTTHSSIDGRLRGPVRLPSEDAIPHPRWPALTADPAVPLPASGDRPTTSPPPEGSTAATYFTALPDGVSVAEQRVNGRTVLILHAGTAPTVPLDRWPAGFATGGLSVYFDLGLNVLTAAASMRNLRPAWSGKLTAQFLGKPQPISGTQASAMATGILGGLSFTSDVAGLLGIEPSPVAMHFPAEWIIGRGTPSEHRIPVDANGRPAFDATADGFRYHPVTHRVPPRTRRIPGGWTLDARESNVFTLTSEPATTEPAGPGTAPAPAPGKSGLIIVGRPGEIVPPEVLDHIEKINTPQLNAEVVMLGAPMSKRQSDQLETVRKALRDASAKAPSNDWQAQPVFNGWVVGRAGAAAPDLGPAASVAPLPGTKVIWVDPSGADLIGALTTAIRLYGKLPDAMRRKVVLQPVPGTTMPLSLLTGLADLAGQYQKDGSRGVAWILGAADFAEPPPADDPRLVPMAWTDDGAVRTLRQFADHYRVYPSDVTPAEPLPEGLTNPGDGWFDVEGLDHGVWSVDTTDPHEVTIAHGITAAVPDWAPPPPLAEEDVRVKIVGPAGPATQAALFRLIEKWRAGRPADIALNGDQRYGRRILENAAIAENLRQSPELLKAMPDGLQVIPVPAGQVFAPAGQDPDDLEAARQMPKSSYATLLWFSGGVEVGDIIAALPDSVRDWAVVHRDGDEALPDPERDETVIRDGKRAQRLAAWEPKPMRQRRWPSTPLSAENGGGLEKRLWSQAVEQVQRDARRRAVHLGRARALAERTTGHPAPAPRPAPAPFSALRLANLGERDHANHRVAKAAITEIDLQRRQLDQFLKKARVSTDPPPLDPAGAPGASAAQHAHAAMMEAIRLRLSGDAAAAAALIEANRRDLIARNNTRWVRWLAQMAQVRPEWAEHVDALSEDVLRCLKPMGTS